MANTRCTSSSGRGVVEFATHFFQEGAWVPARIDDDRHLQQHSQQDFVFWSCFRDLLWHSGESAHLTVSVIGFSRAKAEQIGEAPQFREETVDELSLVPRERSSTTVNGRACLGSTCSNFVFWGGDGRRDIAREETVRRERVQQWTAEQIGEAPQFREETVDELSLVWREQARDSRAKTGFLTESTCDETEGRRDLHANSDFPSESDCD